MMKYGDKNFQKDSNDMSNFFRKNSKTTEMKIVIIIVRFNSRFIKYTVIYIYSL